MNGFTSGKLPGTDCIRSGPMKRIVAIVMLVSLTPAPRAFAQAEKAKDLARNAYGTGGQVDSGNAGEVKKDDDSKRRTAEWKKLSDGSGIMGGKFNDDFYDAFANFTPPEQSKVIPWLVALALGGLCMMIGL